MLFTLIDNNQTILRPECLQLCPPLKVLDNDQALYIILAYDYHSPYHQLPLEERRRTARVQVYGSLDNDPEKAAVVKNAIRAYESLQYDPKRETVQLYISKIKQLERDLHNATTSTEISSITKSISHLNKSAKEIQDEIDRDDNMKALQGGGTLSLLEQMQESRELYKLHHADVSPENQTEEILPESNS